MTITRRTAFGAGFALAMPNLIRSAQAAEYVLKFGTDFASSTALVRRMMEASEAVRVETGGAVEIRMLADGQLGTGMEILSQVRSGAVEITGVAQQIATIDPAVAACNTAFLFNDYAQVWPAMDGELGNFIRSRITKLGNVTPLSHMWNSGFRQITTSAKPLNGPDDLKGLKIRVPANPVYTTLFRALGAAPVSIPYGETYAALQTRLADAQENPLEIILSGKFFEVQKFCALTNHLWDGSWTLVNRRAWQRLPDQARATVEKHITAATLRQREDLAQADIALQNTLREKGLTFNQPDRARFRAALASTSYAADWRRVIGDEAWAVLERSVGFSG